MDDQLRKLVGAAGVFHDAVFNLDRITRDTFPVGTVIEARPFGTKVRLKYRVVGHRNPPGGEPGRTPEVLEVETLDGRHKDTIHPVHHECHQIEIITLP